MGFLFAVKPEVEYPRFKPSRVLSLVARGREGVEFVRVDHAGWSRKALDWQDLTQIGVLAWPSWNLKPRTFADSGLRNPIRPAWTLSDRPIGAGLDLAVDCIVAPAGRGVAPSPRKITVS